MQAKLITVGAATIVAANTFALVSISNTATESQRANEELRVAVDKMTVEVEQLRDAVLYKKEATPLKLTAAEQDCLARNVFYEAGVEDRAGKLAVIQVTVNRLHKGDWGRNVCEVVYAKSQFSWTRDKRKRHARPKGESWEASVQAVHEFKQGWRVKNLENSHYYHTNYISRPRWADPKRQVAKIGQHVFYSEARQV